MPRPRGTTKNKGKKDSFDRFYTDVAEAHRLLELLLEALPDFRDSAIFVEPSAGDGAFVSAMEAAGIPSDRIVALDVVPADETRCHAEIRQHDFLEGDFYEKLADFRSSGALTEDELPLIFVGNPPFGEQCKLAIDFVNRSLELGRHCAFILSPSFHKESVQKKLRERVMHVLPLENVDYRVGDDRISVPSAFFIIDGDRDFVPLPDRSAELPFSKIPTTRRGEADFAIRRVGGTAGSATSEDLDSLSSETYYFYKRDEGCPDDIVEIISSCEFPERDWSVGPLSLSSKEIAKNVYEKLVELGMVQDTGEEA